MTLHRAGKAFTDRRAGYVHILTFKIMISDNLFADINEIVFSNAELSNLCLRFNIRFGELTAVSLVYALGLFLAPRLIEQPYSRSFSTVR